MKRILFMLLILFSGTLLYAQFPYGTTGLLHMPTADMQRDKTFMAGASFLSEGATPKHWNYDTYNYYINITFFPFLEIGYTCTLHRMTVPAARIYNKFRNQDRQFSARLRLIKEAQFWKYMPAVVIGANDPATNDILGNPDKEDYGIAGTASVGNGHWNRYYVAMTKHVQFEHIGNLGTHAAYVYNKRMDYHLNGPAFGANFQLSLPSGSFLRKALNGINLMAEYDARTVNMGLGYSIWKDHINLIGELNDFKYLSAGIYFKVHLK